MGTLKVATNSAKAWAHRGLKRSEVTTGNLAESDTSIHQGAQRRDDVNGR